MMSLVKKEIALLIAVAIIIPALLSAQTVVDTFLVMSDGAKMDALYVEATTPQPQSGFPAIVWIHGFNETKNDHRERSRIYARQGYFNVAYTVRGQGNSDGEFDFFTSNRILDDLREVLAFTKSFHGINPQRVAVVGASQGGVLAWCAAVFDMGVRTVISRLATGRFDEAWTANNTLNWTFVTGSNFSAARVKPELRDSVNRARSSGDVSFVGEYLRQHSTHFRETTNTTPVLMLASYYDQYFSPSVVLRQFADITAPKRIVLYPANHVQPQDLSQRAIINSLHDRWLAYWMKDESDNSAVNPDSAVMLFDAATGQGHAFSVSQSDYWKSNPQTLPKGIARRIFYLTTSDLSEQEPAAQSQRTFSFTPNLGSLGVTYRTQPFTEDRTIAAIPGKVVAQMDGTGVQYQCNLLLFDIDPSTSESQQIARGQFHVYRNTRGETDRLEFELSSTMHTIKAGHLIEARFHGGIGLIPNPLTDFGGYIVPPNTSSTNTLYQGGVDPSRIEIFFYDSTQVLHADAIPDEDLRLNVFPQPVRRGAEVFIRVSAGEQVDRIEIFNAIGMKVLSKEGNGGKSIMMIGTSGFRSGVFHAVVFSRKGILHAPFVLE